MSTPSWLSTIEAVGEGIISTAVPGGAAIVAGINALLPDDKKLPQNATGSQVTDAVSALPPEQQAQVREKMVDLAIARVNEQGKDLDAQNESIASVNATMRVEDETRKLSWRDYWGYVSGTAFGFVVVMVCIMIAHAVWTNGYDALDKIPSVVGAFSVLFGIASTVLGVTSGIEAHHKGMTDRIMAGHSDDQ